MIKVRLQSKAYVGHYSNTFDCIQKVVRNEGALRLYSGFRPHALRNCIFNAQFFSGCHLIRQQIIQGNIESSRGYSFTVDLISGAVMGAVATPLKMPFFVVKTRLQEQAQGTNKYPSSSFGTMQAIAREEGVAALWKGTISASLRLSVGGAVCLACFRTLSDALSEWAMTEIT